MIKRVNKKLFDKYLKDLLIERYQDFKSFKKSFGVTFIRYEKRGNQLKAVEHLMLYPTTNKHLQILSEINSHHRQAK